MSQNSRTTTPSTPDSQQPGLALAGRLEHASKLARRATRRITAPLRPFPDALILGAMKGGTTSAAWYLVQHPRVKAPTHKEIHYLEQNYQRGPAWYREQFPIGMPGRNWLTFEATPYYLSYPLAPERAAATCPDAKLVALLRDPASRAVSQWKHRSRDNRETRSLAQLLADERDMTSPDPRSFDGSRRAAEEHLGHILDHGMYAAQLRRWFQHFPREQMLVIDSAVLFTEPHTAMARIHQFLGIDEFSAPDTTAKNVGDRRSAEEDVVDDLRSFYRPHNEELFELIGERFDWD